MIDVKIRELFRTRDHAVATRNRKLFLATQAGELPNCSFEGYVSVDKLETQVISVYASNDAPLQRVVFAQETYFPKDKEHYSSFVLCFLVDTLEGWKIYRLSF